MLRKKQKPLNNTQLKKDRKVLSKAGNIGFLLAIPGLIVLAGGSSALLIFTLEAKHEGSSHWPLFLGGLASSILLSLTFAVPRLRTLLHEIKHGVVVVLSGNSVKGMKIGKGSGHIDYTLRYDKLHFAPIICLAPYFLPLLSAPVLIAALFLEAEHRELLLFLLGLTLGFDTCTAFYDLHPNQSDLKRIIGGFFVASIFLASAHIFWITTSLIWVEGESSGYIVSSKLFYSQLVNILQQI